MKKKSGLIGIQTHDLCDTSAVLHQLGYQAIWEPSKFSDASFSDRIKTKTNARNAFNRDSLNLKIHLSYVDWIVYKGPKLNTNLLVALITCLHSYGIIRPTERYSRKLSSTNPTYLFNNT